MSAHAAAPPDGGTVERRLPPIAELAVGSMALIVVGGVYLAANMPRHASLPPAIVVLVLAAGLLAANLVLVSRLEDFAWRTFLRVGAWAQLAYVVIAGMLLYVFVLDGTRGGQLAVLTLMLIVFAVDIPLLLAFSVARYQPAEG